MNRNLSYIVLIVWLTIYIIFRQNILNYINQNINIQLGSIEIEVLGGLVGYIIPILAFHFAKYLIYIINPNKKKYLKVLSNCRHWILSANEHWSSTYKGNDRKIANSAEGLFSLIYTFDSIGQMEERIINEVAKYLIENVGISGLKSFSFNKDTVQCTSLGLYVLSILRDKQLYKLSKEDANKILLLYNALINSKSKYGWATLVEQEENSERTRIMTTLWSIRAINAANLYNTNIVSDTVIYLISKIPSGKFGYTFSDHPKLCSTSLFIILLFELKDENLKKEVFKLIDLKTIMDFIISEFVFKQNFIEFEDFDTKSMNLSGVEHLNYRHISIGYALHAISLYKKHLNFFQRIVVNYRVKLIIKNNVNNDGYFFSTILATSKENPHIFPTIYFIEGLYYYIHDFLKKDSYNESD